MLVQTKEVRHAHLMCQQHIKLNRVIQADGVSKYKYPAIPHHKNQGET